MKRYYKTIFHTRVNWHGECGYCTRIALPDPRPYYRQYGKSY